jgi:hypothetical protein
MYLQPEQALGLITECEKRFPGGQMLFDMQPTLFAKLSRNGLRTSRRYKMPPTPVSLSVKQAANLVNTVPGVRGCAMCSRHRTRPIVQCRPVDALPHTPLPPVAAARGAAGVRLPRVLIVWHRLDVAQRVGLAQPQPSSHLDVLAGGGRHRGVGRIVAGNESAEAATGFDDGRGFQLTVRAGHRIDGHAKLTGQLTHGRQSGARRQCAIADSVDDLRPELVKQGLARLQVDP